MADVEKQLEEARQSLLDMSMRNKLLNFKEHKRSTARVVDEVPGEVYRRLVVEGHTMYFKPGEGEDDDLEVLEREEAVETTEEGIWRCLLCTDEREQEEDGADADTASDQVDQETPDLSGDADIDVDELQDTEAEEDSAEEQVEPVSTPSAAVYTGEDAFVDHLETEHGSTLEEHDDSPGNLWQLPAAEEGDRESYRDKNLRTPHTEEDLQKRLYNVSKKAEALIQDAGYNALYLAVGFLEWTHPRRGDDSYRAPLILIPVSIERESARSAFKIKWTEDEVVGNQSLELKLQEYGFELPVFERPDEAEGIRRYLEAVEDAAEDFTDWRVEPDIHLGFFDFTKFVMYQDLDPDGWEEQRPDEHPVVRSLLDPESEVDLSIGVDEPRDPASLDPFDVHHVKDADPSQMSVVEEIRRGQSLVVEGPPGTGKSQTIVNVIAELLADDRSVLFVSEKLAALEVVKDRLDDVGLGDFCLELHSDTASRSEFLDELERLANLDSYDADVPTEVYRELDSRRRELDSYAEALGEPVGAVEKTPHDLIGMREEASREFELHGRELPRTPIEDVEELSKQEFEEIKRGLDALAGYLEEFHPVAASPWYGCQPGRVLPEERRELESRLEHAVDVYDRFAESLERMNDRYPVEPVDSIAQLQPASEAIDVLEQDAPVDVELVEDTNWDSRPEDVDEVIELVERIQELETGDLDRSKLEEVDRDPEELRHELAKLKGSLSRYLRPRWYGLKNDVDELYNDRAPSMDEALEDLESLVELEIKLDRLEEVDERGRELFGDLWKAADSDPDELRRFSEWIVPFRRHLIDGVIDSTKVVEYLEGEGCSHPHEPLLAEAESNAEDLLKELDDLISTLDADIDLVFGDTVEEADVDVVGNVLRGWRDGTTDLERWARYNEVREELLETPAASIVNLVDEGKLPPELLKPCFTGNLSEDLLDVALRERTELARFDGDVHERTREEFRKLDRETLELNRRRVMEELVESTPRLMEGASKSSGAGVLMHEFGKERRHKPIRVLLEDAGELVQQLKPCFMMSPLSVAKYLEPGELEFDVVVFDEASQVRPEDALGALLRAEQVVMLGDSKQLPPTGFFDQVVDQVDPDDPWSFSVQDVESVLDLCRAALPTRRLKWHYRSRHESLIEVSNKEFYDDDLLVYPSPLADSDELGLEHEYLPDTYYDRGGSSVNRGEAEAVAEAAVEHFRENPDESLGVGTFSQSQQQAVMEEVERLRKENPEVDDYFQRDRDEQFFVKNLERIQGDERDVIYISVGYGYDEDDGFSLNFGPLNQDGGWRRLNVLITRARKRCRVYSNFKSSAIDAENTDARGVESLKTFLEHAESGGEAEALETADDPESTFVECVAEFLESQGYKVDVEVGSADYRVDVGVRHPEDSERYVLAVLCDGPSYHGSDVARARDRQREAVLEDRGWSIERVWSTDWYRDRNRARQKLLEACERAVSEGGAVDSAKCAEEEVGTEVDVDVGLNGDDGGVVSVDELQSGENLSIMDLAEPYQKARDVPFVLLSERDTESAVEAVQQVVEQEAPVHRELLYRRLVERSDVDRVSESVKETVDKAVFVAEQRGKVESSYDFVYPDAMDEVPVRTRDGEEAEIDWVAPEEIAAAVLKVVDAEYGVEEDDLVRQVAGLLGFERTGRRIAMKVGDAVDRLLESGAIEEGEDGWLEISNAAKPES